MKTIYFAVVLMCGCIAFAQTNLVTRTNIIRAAPNYRVVRGQVYNTLRSVKWHEYKAEVIQTISTNVLLTRQVEEKTEYEIKPTHGLSRVGGFGSGGGILDTEEVGTTRKYFGLLLVTNYSNASRQAPRSIITFSAMKVDEKKYNQQTADVLDCGIVNKTAVIVTNRVIAPTRR